MVRSHSDRAFSPASRTWRLSEIMHGCSKPSPPPSFVVLRQAGCGIASSVSDKQLPWLVTRSKCPRRSGSSMRRDGRGGGGRGFCTPASMLRPFAPAASKGRNAGLVSLEGHGNPAGTNGGEMVVQRTDSPGRRLPEWELRGGVWQRRVRPARSATTRAGFLRCWCDVGDENPGLRPGAPALGRLGRGVPVGDSLSRIEEIHTVGDVRNLDPWNEGLRIREERSQHPALQRCHEVEVRPTDQLPEFHGSPHHSSVGLDDYADERRGRYDKPK